MTVWEFLRKEIKINKDMLILRSFYNLEMEIQDMYEEMRTERILTLISSKGILEIET